MTGDSSYARSLSLAPDFEEDAETQTRTTSTRSPSLSPTTSASVHTGEYDVTVKVINSTDDNQAREGDESSNRQPEVARALTATFEDPDDRRHSS